MRYLLPVLILLAFIPIAHALPISQSTQSLLPFVTDTYYLGTTTPSTLEYQGIITKNLTITGTCTGCTSGAVTAVTGTWPIISSGGATPNITWGGLATSSPFSVNQIVYTNAAGQLVTVASSSLNVASSTLLGDNNTFSGTDKFTNTITGSITGLAGTATALAANGTNCSSGNAPLGVDASGNAENCFAVQAAGTYLTALGSGWASTTGATITHATSTVTVNGLTYGVQVIPAASTLTFLPTVTGTYTGQAGSVANALTINAAGTGIGRGGTYDGSAAVTLSYNSIGALSTSTGWTAPGQLAFVTSSSTVSGVATSSLGVTAPITFSGTIGAQVGGVGGSFGCTSASSGVTGCLTGTDWTTFNNKQATISATWPITLTGAAVGWNGLATSSPFSVNQFVFTNAAGNLATVASSSLNLPNAALTNSSLTVTANSPLTGGGAVSLGGSTSLGCQTSSDSQAGCLASADWTVFNNKVSSTSLSSANGLLTYVASTGVFTASTSPTYNAGATTTDFAITHLTNALLATNAQGSVISTTSIATSLLSANTISGVALGGTLGALSHDTTLTGTSYTGSAAVSNWGIDLTHANTWTGSQMLRASTTIGNGTQITGLTINGGATTTGNTWFSGSNFHFGTTSDNLPASNCSPTNAAACLELIGNDNSTAGVSMVIENISNGPHAYSDLFFGNDNTTVGGVITNYADLNFNGHAYNAAADFGALFNVADQLSLNNTVGPVLISAAGASQYINFATAGTAAANERMRITAAGNVGIGVTAPLAVLHIASTTPGTYDSTNTLTNAVMVIDGTTVNNQAVGLAFKTHTTTSGIKDPAIVAVRVSASAGELAFLSANGTNAIEAMRIDSAGNVGIGTSSPQALFHVSSSNAGVYAANVLSTGNKMYFENSSTVDNSLSRIVFNTDDTTGLITNAVALTAIFTSHTAGAVSGDLAFQTRNAGTNAERMRLTSAGNLGIATATPAWLLQVSSTTAPQLTLSGGTNHFSFRSLSGYLYIATSSATTFATSSTAITITPNGYLGIGSTTPSAALGVQGTIAAVLTTFAAGDSAVCQRGAGGLMTFDSGVSSCIVSSRTVKHDIRDLSTEDALARISALNPVTFEYNGTNKPDIGLVAEEVAAIDPRYAQYNDKGEPRAINWSAITADMIKAMQAQKGLAQVKRSAEENWQWAAILFLLLLFVYQQRQIIQLKKQP